MLVPLKSKGNGDYLREILEDQSITSSAAVEELLEEIDLLKKEIEEFKKAEDEQIERIKRIQADYENYRKRTLKEQLELIKRANKDLIEKMLPVLDSFDNAIDIGIRNGKEDDEFFRGIKMIYDKLMEVLGAEGLKVIDPIGEEFDPHICEATLTEKSDEFKENQIISVLRKGYMLGDYVIRPAEVKVCVK